MELPEERRLSVAEYLEMEQASREKHELRNGLIIDMAGGSITHATIASNIVREAGVALKGKPCRIYGSDLRVRIPRKTYFMYPDATIVCGEPQFDPDDRSRSSISNPRVIIEVLSPSTELYDRGEKFDRYTGLESLQEYVLISQDAAHVQVYLRREDGAWVMTRAHGLEAVLRLQSVGVSVPLSEVYAGVELPPERD